MLFAHIGDRDEFANAGVHEQYVEPPVPLAYRVDGFVELVC